MGKPANNYASTGTKPDKLVDGYTEENSDQTKTVDTSYVEPSSELTDQKTSDGYSEDSAPVKITQTSYTDDSASLVSDNTDSYNDEKTSEKIVEEVAVQS